MNHFSTKAFLFSLLLLFGTIELLNSSRCDEVLPIGTNNSAFVTIKNSKNFEYAVADSTNNVLLRSEVRGTKVLAGHGDRVNILLQLGNTDLLASSSLDSSVRVWNTTSGHFITNFMWHSTEVKAMGYIDSYDKIITSAARDTIIWDYRTGNIMRKVDLPSGSEVLGILTIPGTQFVVLSGSSNDLYVYDIPKFSFTRLNLTNPKEGTPTLTTLFSGVFAYASENSNTIDFYDFRKGRVNIPSIELSPSVNGVKAGGLVYVNEDHTLYVIGNNGHLKSFKYSSANSSWALQPAAFYQSPPLRAFLGPIGYESSTFSIFALLENGVKKFNLKQTPVFSYQGECRTGCPEGTFVLSGSCGTCDPSCGSCVDSSPNSCLTCKLPGVMFYGRCVRSCPSHSHLVSGAGSCVCNSDSVLTNGHCKRKIVDPVEPPKFIPTNPTTPTTPTTTAPSTIPVVEEPIKPESNTKGKPETTFTESQYFEPYSDERVESPNLVAILVPIFSVFALVVLGVLGYLYWRRRSSTKALSEDGIDSYDTFSDEIRKSAGNLEKGSTVEVKRKIMSGSRVIENSMLFPQHKIGKPISPTDFSNSGIYNSNHPQMVRLGTGNPY